MALAEALEHLRCPHCAADLALTQGAVRCASGHAFDVARQGYLSLLAGGGGSGPAGDTAAMIAARAAFLDAGHMAPLADAVAAAAAEAAHAPGGCVIELGAGTGAYLARALDALPGRAGLALDASRYALRRAARAHPRAAAIGADAWSPLPIRDATAAVVLSVFAPRNGPEIHRVLRPGGALVVAAPTERHLAELREPLGLLSVDARKDERLARQLEPLLEPRERATCEWTMVLDHDAAAAVAGMGPSAFHADPEARALHVAALPEPLSVTGSVTVTTYGRS